MNPLRIIVVIVLAALVLALPGCSGDEDQARVIVLGIDGLDPYTADLLMSEGKLPNLARMRQEGAYAPLLSQKPLLSPVVWTTIATGRTPVEHRIGHFVAIDPSTGEPMPVTSSMRGVKALWNIASERAKRVGVVGWWATWPPEKVNGTIVSDRVAYHFLLAPPGGAAGSGTIHPPDAEPRLRRLVRQAEDVDAATLSRFVNVLPEEAAKAFDFDDPVSHLRWAIASAETHRDAGLEIWESERPDLLMVYIEAVDSTSHLFGHLFRTERLSGELAEQQKKFGRAVEEMYRFADEIVGRYLEAMDDDTTLLVVSDHGFELGALHADPSRTRDMRRVSEQHHRLRGVIYAYGRNVRRHASFDRPTILDVAPTVLALGGLPPADDMPGRVLVEGLKLDEPERIASYEAAESVRTADRRSEQQGKVDAEMLKQLRSLGYLDAASPSGERNLAAMLFEEERYEESIEAYRKLLAASPDDAELHASIAGALGAAGRFDEALQHLDVAIRLEPLAVEAHHNRAVVHERKGNREAAIADYQSALRYNPQYAPSAQALRRLGVGRRPHDPRNEQERKALVLATEAAELAQRGDYQAAAERLREAERIAPQYALVHQYRSNVAWLSGDREGAIAALEKALRLEPENALYRENLKALRGASR